MGKKIYIVTSGCYSDYQIEAVFTTEEKANEYVQQHGTDYNIEEYDVDEEVVKSEKSWSVEFYLDKDFNLGNYPPTASCASWRNTIDPKDTCHVSLYAGMNAMNFKVVTDSLDKAIKIASERLAAIKSNDYIWSRLTTPYAKSRYGVPQFERFNTKTNEFTKEQ